MQRASGHAGSAEEPADRRSRGAAGAAGEGKAQSIPRFILDAAPVEKSRLGFNAYFAICFSASATPCILAILLWSDMGWGKRSNELLEANTALAKYCAGAVAAGVLVLYCLDFFCPPHLPGQYFTLLNRDPFLRFVIVGLLGIGVVGTSLLCSKGYPMLPLLVTIICGPSLLAIVRLATRPRCSWPKDGMKLTDQEDALLKLVFMAGEEGDSRNFYAGAMASLLISGGATVIVWVLWALGKGLELSSLKLGDQHNEKMYIRWIAPLVAGVANVLLGFIAQLRVTLSKDYADTDDLRVDLILKADGLAETDSRESLIGRQMQRSGTLEAFSRLPKKAQQRCAKEHLLVMRRLLKIMKFIGCCLLTLMGCIYVAAELIAADSRVAQLLLGFVGVLFLCFLSFLFASFGRLMITMKDWLLESPLGRMGIALSDSDWVRAAILCAAVPALPVLLLLSAMNQLVRRFRGLYVRIRPRQVPVFPRDVRESPQGANGSRASQCTLAGERIEVGAAPEDQLVTEEVMVQLAAVRSWDWISVVSKMYVLAMGFLCYILSPRLLNVALSWLNTTLREGLPFGLIVLVTMLAGITCFLLPPVPGLPVYLFTGVIVVATSPFDFWLACALSVAICMVLKMCACAIQQKLIGESLGGSVRVKSQVGVNRPFFRAVEAVLRRPGLSWGKVAILCGGPDWPTSVLCGLLRCSLLEMELGTLPIVVFVTPCTLSGSFYLRKGESQLWSSATNLMIAASVAVNMAFGVGAAWAIQEELDGNSWEVTKPMVQHVELDWLDFRSAQIAQSCVVRWRELPLPVRGVALLGVLVEIAVGHLLYWRSSACFGAFKITDDIRTLVWYGDRGLFKFQGVLGLGCAAVGFLGYACLRFFLWRKRAGPFAAKAERLKAIERPWKGERVRQALLAEKQARLSLSEVTVEESKTFDGVKGAPEVRRIDKE